MKQKKYSDSKIKTAQKFLSKYDLPFETLDESQKKVVINYTGVKKLFWLVLAALIFGFVVDFWGACLIYSHSQTIFDQAAERSASAEKINLHTDERLCFMQGFTVGLEACAALVMLSCIIMFIMISRWRGQVFDAFLPSLKNNIDNDQTPID